MTSKAAIIETPLGKATLKRSDRKTLAISVYPDGLLELVSPQESSLEDILTKVRKRKKWILSQRAKFKAMNASRTEPRYVNGATHRYLGRQYRLKITAGEETGVSLKGAYFLITVKSMDPLEVRKQLGQWFREKAAIQFQDRLDAWAPWCRRHKLPEPRLKLLKMAKRWGSASQNGRIAINPELIHMPSRCIDYVITHEICHLRHPNHGQQFYRLLSSQMPDWRSVKERLENIT